MENKFYITTAIAYVNALPHIGHVLEFVQADVLTRWHRQKNEGVFFLTGVDEYGVKIVRAAEAAGKTPEELADENSEKFKELRNALNLSWDNFIRTSDQKIHWPVAQGIWKRIAAKGDLYKKTYKGFYCVGHEAFVTRKDLIDGKCVDHQKAPEVVEEENWFFKLSKYAEDVKKVIESGSLKIIPETRKNEVISFLDEGLEDVSFSRPSKDLSWGIPVPGDATQTMYVWTDALSNYISGYGGIEKWQEHPADVHMIGKDILRFHAVIWPAMLLSAGLKLPKVIFAHGHILSNSQKMSKSLGNVVSSFELVKKYGTDAVRYFLLREFPSTEDGDFSYEKFEGRYNGDLANGLGNFVARVSALTVGQELKYTDAVGSDEELLVTGSLTGRSPFFEKFKNGQVVNDWIENFRFDLALASIMGLVNIGDAYVNASSPWDKKIDKEEQVKHLSYLVNIVYKVGILLKPFLPETADKIIKSFEIKDDKIITLHRIVNLFPRLEK